MDSSWLISAKAQYATAWIYEHDLVMRDSALAAYNKLIDNYPTAVADTSSQTAAAPDSSALIPGGEITAGSAGFVLGSEDILQQKIQWRIRRDRVGSGPRE